MKYRQHYLHHLFIRVEVPDFGAWYREHKRQARERAEYGLCDGPVYRELDNPNVAMVQLNTNDLPKALKWFKTTQFRDANLRAGVREREFYDTASRKMFDTNERSVTRAAK